MSRKDKSPAGLRVRYGIVELLYRAPSRETQLPSASELASRYNISMSTVNRELKKLVEEGLIIGRQGVGMFTVPNVIKIDDRLLGRRLVGIIYGDGRYLCYGLCEWTFITSCGFALLPGIAHPRYVNLIAGHPDDIAAELQSQSLDGIIAIRPSKNLAQALQTLQSHGMPVVAAGSNVEGMPSLLADHRQAGRDMARQLQQRGVRSILWMSFDPICREHLAGLREYCAEANTKIKISEVANMSEFEAKVSDYAQKNAFPDAVFLHGETICALPSTLQRLGITPPNWLTLSEIESAERLAKHHGLVRAFPYRDIARQAAACLEEQFTGKTVAPEYTFLYQVAEM